MFGKLIGLATLPLDIAKDVITLGGVITETKSATMDKIEYLTGEKEFKREQDRKDLETIAKLLKERDSEGDKHLKIIVLKRLEV